MYKEINQKLELERRRDRKAIVIMNENHSMMEEQEEILESYAGYEILAVPSSGWTIAEIDVKIHELTSIGNIDVVFVSPIPYMVMQLTRAEVVDYEGNLVPSNLKVKVFHNDNREKKELPNGKIIQVVSTTGWQLV